MRAKLCWADSAKERHKNKTPLYIPDTSKVIEFIVVPIINAEYSYVSTQAVGHKSPFNILLYQYIKKPPHTLFNELV